MSGDEGCGAKVALNDELGVTRVRCDCCDGRGTNEDIYGNEGACMTCNGSGVWMDAISTVRMTDMTPEEYELEVLRSADADGILHPKPLTDWWAQQSILVGMYMRAEIDRQGDGPMHTRTGPYCIAPAGLARLSMTPNA